MTSHMTDGIGPGHPAAERPTGYEPSQGAETHDRLDITQLVFCALAVGLLMLGVNRVGQFDNPTHTAFLGAITTLAGGGACFAVAWTRTIWFHYMRDTEPTDIRLPDWSVSNVDKVTAWIVPIVISAGLLAAPETTVRLAAVLPIVGALALAIYWREYPTYAFPIIDAIGITRAVALTVGAIAALRALINFRTADHVSLILLIVAGTLLLAAAIERWPGIGRRRGNKLRDRVATLEHKMALLEKGATGRRAVATADHRRPLWLIVLIAVACAGGAGYALWRALNANGRSSSDIIALLVFAGFALILAVGGERLTNLTFKAGTAEVTVGLETDDTQAGGGTNGEKSSPDTAQPIALTRRVTLPDIVHGLRDGRLELRQLDADARGDQGPALMFSPPGENLTQSVAAGRAMAVTASPPAPSVTPHRKIRQLTVRGNADDVAALLDSVLPSA
jgi:hypothetical protein